MHHLRARMHAAVGAARAGDAHRCIGNARQRRFERVLHGAAARLRLPAEEAAAVVFDAQRDSGRHNEKAAVA
jgi:hypothetical protein